MVGASPACSELQASNDPEPWGNVQDPLTASSSATTTTGLTTYTADIVRDLAFWRVHAPVAEDILGAIDLQRRHKISFWDAMIIWSASQPGCATILSEDLAANRTYDGVLVQNPFLSCFVGAAPEV